VRGRARARALGERLHSGSHRSRWLTANSAWKCLRVGSANLRAYPPD